MGYYMKVANKQMAADLSKKWYQEYLVTGGCVHACLSLNLIWAFRLLVQGQSRNRPQPIRNILVEGVEASRLVICGY